MKYQNLLFLVILMTLISLSCTDDTGQVTVTYQEASAIYGDMDAIRSIPINEGPQSIVDPGKIYIGENFVLIGEEGEGIHVVNNYDRTNPTSSAFITSLVQNKINQPTFSLLFS